MDFLNSLVFDRSPTPMWLKDYSGVRTLLLHWKSEGVEDIRQFLTKNPARVRQCFESVKVLKVNHKTLELFGARDLNDFQEHVDDVILPNFFPAYVELISQLWEKSEFFVPTCTHQTLQSDALYLQLRGYIGPNGEKDWSRVLVSTEDITSYKQALQREEANRKLAESFFNHSPAALLIVNFSPLKSMIDQLHVTGVTELETYFDQHPEFIQQCLDATEILDANQSALTLFCAPDTHYLIKNFKPKQPELMRHFLLHMYQGKLSTKQEATLINFVDQTHHIYLQITVLPDHEQDWARVQMALTDITAIKQAELRLKFASEHDSLTNVYNRTYYAQELQRLEDDFESLPLSCIFIDINGLKATNDQYGHEVGDQLIIQTAEILKLLSQDTAYTVSRIGGDEFVILMPETSASKLEQMVKYLDYLVTMHNRQPNALSISFSMGYATRLEHECIKDMLHRADQLMYSNKQSYYFLNDRRHDSSASL